MDVLTVLKHAINAFFFVYLIIACLWMIPPINGTPGLDFINVINNTVTNGSGGPVEEIEGAFYWYQLIWFTFHIIMFLLILFFFRKFVLHSVVGESFDKSTRKYLRYAGICCIIYGAIRVCTDVIGPLAYYWRGAQDYLVMLSMDFVGFGSPFFTLIIGLFFMYLSKVLALSEMIHHENELTI